MQNTWAINLKNFDKLDLAKMNTFALWNIKKMRRQARDWKKVTCNTFEKGTGQLSKIKPQNLKKMS